MSKRMKQGIMRIMPPSLVAFLVVGLFLFTAVQFKITHPALAATTSVVINSPANNAFVNSTAAVNFSWGVANATDGTITFDRTGGTPDPNAPHVYTMAAGELTFAGNPHNKLISALNSDGGFSVGGVLVGGTVYTITVASASDGVTASVTNITYDTSAPSINVSYPLNNAYRNNQLVSYSPSELLASGSIVFTRTGGVADANSPHTCTFQGTALVAGIHDPFNLSTGGNNCVAWANPLVNGAIYSVDFNGTDVAGNVATTVTSTGVTYDTTAPVISEVSPISSTILNVQRVSYTLSEASSSVAIVFTRTAGPADASSPHTCALQGAALSAGVHTNFMLATGDNACGNWVAPLITADTYTITFNATDLAGNAASTVTAASVSILPASLTATSAILSTTQQGSNSVVTLNMTLANNFPNNGKVVVTFPEGFNVAGASSVTATNMDGTFVVTSADNDVTMARQGDGTITVAGTAVTLELSFVNNPMTVGTTGTFTFNTETSGSSVIDTDAEVAGVTITAIPVVVETLGGGGGGGGGGAIVKSPFVKPVTKSPPKDTSSTETVPPVAPVPPVAFTDIIGHWAEAYINKIRDLGIVNGKTPTKYAPDDNVSRAEIIKIAVNAFKHVLPKTVDKNPLPDVDMKAWYAPYVQAALTDAIISGFEKGLGPNTFASRGMAVTILAKATGFTDIQANFDKNYAGKKTAHFPDVPATDPNAPFIAYLYDKGIISGYVNGKFGLKDNVTRAEIAKIVVKLIEFVNSGM